ncbi:uncharacterized protein LOC117650304 [Thrips palmi]|uniref:Uncharacterized protein LOC117650304 n=1 Tax=Thrips palmi TaxID=161013 RepID=A0A6P8ZVY0_THRPL|nr:uncharacterized protein LOC117650304 [Thrips palmi]
MHVCTFVRMKETVADCHSQQYVEPPTLSLRHRSIQEESLLYILPTEVLEIIILLLDSVSSVRLACTCAKFYNLVNETAPWNNFVRHEISEKRELLDLGLHFGVPLWRRSLGTLNHAPWKQIVYSRKICNAISNWDFTLAFETSIQMDDITSVDIAGQAVVFGTRRGGLALWNPDEYGLFINTILHATAEIDQIFVHLSSGCRGDNFDYRVIVHSIDTALIIYDMSGYTLVSGVSKMKDLKKISNHGESLVEWDPIRGHSADTTIREKLIQRCVNFTNMHARCGPFSAIDTFEHLYVSQSKGPLILRPSSCRNIPIIEQLLATPDNLNIAKSFIWPGRISFSITSGRVTIISVGEKCKSIRWPNTFRCVSANLFTNVLAVGTDCGQVLLYTFKSPLELLNLDPLNHQKSLSTGTAEPIIYVGLRAPNHVHHLPDVVAATRRSLFCFRTVS